MEQQPKHSRKDYLTLFTSTFTLSAFTFGGGFVIIPLMRKKFVEQLHWIDEEEMMDLTAIAQSSPGAIAVNASILVGYRVAGVPGALVTVLGTVLPPLIILSIISFFYTAFRDNRIVALVMRGMQAGVAAVICDVVLTMVPNSPQVKAVMLGEDGVAAYGVMMYVSMIFSAAFMGYSIGTAPIVSYHFGAQNHSELQSLLRKSLKMVAIFGVVMVLASQALARPLAAIFVGYDAELMAMTISGFRIFGLSFLFMGFAIYASGFFTALSDGLTSALIAFLRTLVFQVAAVLLLPKLWELNGIWLSIVVAEVMAVVLSALFLLLKRKKYHY